MKHIMNNLNRKIPDNITWILLVLISVYLYFFGEYMYSLTHWLRVPGSHTLMVISGLSEIGVLFLIWLLYAPVRYLPLRFLLAVIAVFLNFIFMPTY